LIAKRIIAALTTPIEAPAAIPELNPLLLWARAWLVAARFASTRCLAERCLTERITIVPLIAA